jgi:small neutral amino acid transporter SnatA (MarC family)
VKKFGIRSLSIAALAAAFLLTLAPPAGATTTVLANEKYKWFYWIGFVLAVSFVGWLVSLVAGYYVRVLRPKWRGQKSP